MAVPKRKTSRARRDSRHSGRAIKPAPASVCANCSAPISSHQVCDQCGFYKGRKIMKTGQEKLARRKELQQAKAASQQAKQHEDEALEAKVEEGESKP
ncbi:50S ribosomal protein L32 [bacterium]|jgi:large subunit ribosomal protein L32|nr:50S ribosomal protein L32 [bacterium]